MKEKLLLIIFLLPTVLIAQVTVDPAFPSADEEITITYNAAQGTSGLQSATGIKMHAGIILSGPTGTGWTNVIGNWGDPASPGSMTSLGNNLWQIKLTPRTYFNIDQGVRIYRIGMVFRETGPCGGFGGNSTACKEGKTASNSDFFVDLYEGAGLQVTITEPNSTPLFKDTGDEITIRASASEPCNLSLKINDVVVTSVADAVELEYTHTIIESEGISTILVEGEAGGITASDSLDYVVRTETSTQSLPDGVIAGINYFNDATRATLVLWAPQKSSAYAVGDFSDWKVSPEYQMKRDGEYFWIELSGLNPQEEYSFQYLVDETLWIADPFTDKVLDPDDQYIPDDTYPDLKPFPDAAKKDQWYFNTLSVLQTGQVPYQWQTANYQAPEKENLIIYELLLRDFFENGERNYQNLIDTLGYLKRLGINAIQLMPIMEFNGNESWGYNPAFMLAPDKYYGTKNKLKEFVDKAHAEGIAVILDIAMNHHNLPNPFVMMYFNFTTYKPTPSNPWFNVDAKHPFNVFYDMNHESTYTKAYLDSVNSYWLTEFKVDGFRYDLSKGFTQTNSGSDVGAWGVKDASRIAILKRMGTEVWNKHPNAILILEHFAANDEEIELSDFGFLLWGNMNDAYSKIVRGSGGDMAGGFYKSRNWTNPHLVTYMESHDEERLMYNNLNLGASFSSYNVKNLNTALERMKGISTFFFLQPGPKMIWQFGELGFEYSINRCDDGTISNDCRLTPKPVVWQYQEVSERIDLYNHISNVISLRNEYPVFGTQSVTFAGTSMLKQLTLKGEPYTESPQSADEMNVHIIGNFDVRNQFVQSAFPHTGKWYVYSEESEIVNVPSSPASVLLTPGEVKIYTDYPLQNITSVDEETADPLDFYPNPVGNVLRFNEPVSDVTITDMSGRKVSMLKTNEFEIDVSNVPDGLYILRFTKNTGRSSVAKIVVR